MIVDTLHWVGGPEGHVSMIEQTLLPGEHRRIDVKTVPEMVAAIRRLAVRGAPAIGVAAAFGLLLGLEGVREEDADGALGRVREVAATLARSRPTAVNLFWALDRMVARAEAERERTGAGAGEAIVSGLFDEAQTIHREDQAACRSMGEHGAALIEDGWTILTHCNAGALATAGMGTALAPIYRAVEDGKEVSVYADETRPLLQGARLTSWELMQAGIDVTLITDSTAARVFSEGRIDAVIVGSDRIAGNGDVCNKIGTYGVAILAREHGVPFFVVAPRSTFDASLASGAEIPIEERSAEEVTCGFGQRTAPEGVQVYSPAFDVTPARLVTAIVTEVGVIEEPTKERVGAHLGL
ncbi:MAG: S-methyl-5-thioribose-1-phosphate isomerase [Planctomycetes bacterium]|nr:S-methyl-5-thioribose-1-phosphate isomerase [Planctomycetota bacterium]HJO26324.1 S-methyl-5-thioribose-1-phosphate isomerase [Planctomycetota bacterium]